MLKFDINFNIGFERKDFGDRDYISICPISDLHVGNMLCREDYISDVVNYIKEDEHRYAILNGDVLECVTKNSLGNIYKTKYPNPDDQYERVVELLDPISDRIISVTSGNHERRVMEHDYNKQLAERYDAVYHDTAVYLEIRVGKKTKNKKPFVYSLYHTHGSGGGVEKGGKANKLFKYSRSVIADVIVLSHMHDSMYFPKVVFVPDFHNKNLIPKKQRMILLSGMLDYGDYAARGGSNPSPIELTELVFHGRDKGGIQIFHHG